MSSKSDKTQILFYSRDRKKYEFLSNFFPCKFFLDGQVWLSVEQYYQAQKSENLEYKNLILNAKTALEVKKIGDSRGNNVNKHKESWFEVHTQELRFDWEKVKYDVMKKAVFAKFSQNPNLKNQILKTNDFTLIEDSIDDCYWGIGEDGTGQNILGNILMEVRSKLKNY
jgi:N-glycosidase YbiA